MGCCLPPQFSRFAREDPTGCPVQYKGGPWQYPPHAENMSPWVRCCLKKGGTMITVGNHSSPSLENQAVIKEFEFGGSDGVKCTLVIHDQGGSSFEMFMRNLVKDMTQTNPAGVLMQVQWGWIRNFCKGPVAVDVSDCHELIVDNVETNFADGKFMFTITGADICSRMFEAHSEKNYGTDDHKVDIRVALHDLLVNGNEPPSINGVFFMRVENDGSITPADFMHAPIMGTWVPEGRNKMDAATKWVDEHRSDRDKGWVPAYNSINQTLIFWEDAKPKCGEFRAWEAMSIGSYLVNGGHRSNVIEFNPRIRWDFANITNAMGATGEGTPMANPLKRDRCGNPLVGHGDGRIECDLARCLDVNHSMGNAVHGVMDRRTKDNNDPKKATGEKLKNVDRGSKAVKFMYDQIQADLVVTGNPQMIHPLLGMWARNVSIAFINPYHLMPETGNACGDWIVRPTCNEVLSNKAWLIKKIVHKISPGSYQTILTVYLTTPGIDIGTCEPVGGEGSSGWGPCKGG